MKKIYQILCFCLVTGLLIALWGCGKAEEENREVNTEVTEFSVEGLLEFCVHPENGDFYCSLAGDSTIYHYNGEGECVERFPVTADDGRVLRTISPGAEGYEKELTGLCIDGDTLYCYRMAKQTILSLNLITGENEVCMETEGITIHKAEALGNTLLFYGILSAGPGESFEGRAALLLFDLSRKEWGELAVSGQPMGITRDETSGVYWLAGYEDAAGIFLQKYDPGRGVLSERYVTGLQDVLYDIAYSREEGALYGYVLNTMEYVKLVPEDARAVSRFLVRKLTGGMPRMQVQGERLYVQDKEAGRIYAFYPESYLANNKPLKGYVLQTADIDNWLGYNIDLEKISWEDLALKVLAGDGDFDFVILSTDMPEVLTMRNAMTYQPIPEESIAAYWENCQPFIREAALWQGDVWMLPLNVRAEGIVYSDDKLGEYGIEMAQLTTWEELYGFAERLYEDGKMNYFALRPPGYNAAEYYTEAMVQNHHIEYDTPEFRKILEQERAWKDNAIWDSYISIGNEPNFGYPQTEDKTLSMEEREELRRRNFLGKIYFEQISLESGRELEKYAGMGNFRVCRVPRRSEADDYVRVTADVLIVNPRSANLEDTLKFAADMASAYLDNPDTHLSAKEELYGGDTYAEDLLALYSRGRLCFGYPAEIFEPYYLYLAGELDEDAMIEELNRKVNMYLGE
ncbi:MAG: hypothetical protein NC123_13045 [Butyrivibrio sp.]|nr:hypothetical protein [Acetatifactor muris]MCM1558084.1 hypothetical protein [Butyrivibrio sp.]MCM1560447.1 hypothetical protein [Butyrivibrio sp.]